MKLYEYKAKEVFRRYSIPTPKGIVVAQGEEVNAPPVPTVVKAQVLMGGRMKAGGVKFAETAEEARQASEAILGMEIAGLPVQRVLLEEKLSIARELYLSITLDRGARAPLLMASAEGGIDIEEVPAERLLRVHLPPMLGMQPYVLRRLRAALDLPEGTEETLEQIAEALFALFTGEEAELVEINPLVLTTDGTLVAGDAKLIIEDNALYRHPAYRDLERHLTPLEREAQERGIAFIQLGGNIGVIANGAGLTMATMDTLYLEGGTPGVFLDLGGTDDAETVKEAFLLMVKAEPAVIFLNIFGGITKCDTVARGVMEAFEAAPAAIPVVARIRGVKEVEARGILQAAGITAHLDMRKAARAAVRQAGT